MDFERWFIMARVEALDDVVRSTIVHNLTRVLAGYPKPIDAPLKEPGEVLDYLLARRAAKASPVMNTSPSGAAMLAERALERGETLDGVHFLLGAEPVTRTRWEAIRGAGANPIATYGTSECGFIGAQFPGATEIDEVHVFRDAWAVVAVQLEVDDEQGSQILFTGLRPAAPKVLINAGIGDSAIVESDSSGPPVERLGYDVRIHTIRSFGKITVWGATFAVTDLIEIIESTLLPRFGGTLMDYQLIEGEETNGRPSLTLRVAPSIGSLDETELLDVFLAAVARRRSGYRFMAEEIRSTGTLSVIREEPTITARGKVIPVVPRRTK
jgi:hypothetical protein